MTMIITVTDETGSSSLCQGVFRSIFAKFYRLRSDRNAVMHTSKAGRSIDEIEQSMQSFIQAVDAAAEAGCLVHPTAAE